MKMIWISILKTSGNETLKMESKLGETKVKDRTYFMKSKESKRQIDTKRLRWMMMK